MSKMNYKTRDVVDKVTTFFKYTELPFGITKANAVMNSTRELAQNVFDPRSTGWTILFLFFQGF